MAGWEREQHGARPAALAVFLLVSIALLGWWVTGGYEQTHAFFNALDDQTVGRLGWPKHQK